MPDASAAAPQEGLAISVEVIYATPDSIWRRHVALTPRSTIRDALAASAFFDSHPEYPTQALAVGIYGRRCASDQVLTSHDRVEIYRPLIFDPMESRRRRARHRQNSR